MKSITDIVKVAYIIDTISCDTAGTQKQLLETIKRLDKNIYIPHLICLWQSEWMTNNALPCTCTVLGYRGFLKLNFPLIVWQLRGLIMQNQFHIIQTFYVDSIFVTFITKLIIYPFPALISSRRDIGLGEQNHPWYHKIFAVLLPIVNILYDGIISNSEQVRQYVAENESVALGKIRVIRNGIELPKIDKDVPIIFRNNSDVIWIGLSASLTKVKRHDILLYAVSLLREMKISKKIRVLILGDGPEKHVLEQLSFKLNLNDTVHFQGVVSDIVNYLHYLDICVLCSDREGLSNAILEYMACGKPVIATSVGGNIELVDDENGILVPPDNPEALARALFLLIMDDDKRKQMGKKSLLKAREQFSWQKSMSNLENYYQQIVEGL